MRKMLCAITVLFVVCGTASAGQFIGSIHKIGDGKITVEKIAKNRKGKTAVLKVAKKVKVNRLKINFAKRKLETSKPFPDGLKNKAFKKIGKRGVVARIITNDDNEVTQITLFPAGFKIRVAPKKKKDKDGV